MVAYAIKNDLDQLAANNNVERLTITPADDSQIPQLRKKWSQIVTYVSGSPRLLKE